jgi:5'-methylthioadenosine phosphorylase
VDVIGMTNLQEARLSREAELCYATLAMVTDFDCWHEDEPDVNVFAIRDVIAANAALSQSILREVVRRLPDPRSCACSTTLDHSIFTDWTAVPPATLERLEPILRDYRRRKGL